MKLIHAVKVLQLLFVVKMACVVMKILYTMQLSIMPMNVNVCVLITTQVRSNTYKKINGIDSLDFISVSS